jgi:nucleotide-binding universal stress UspA family protein
MDTSSARQDKLVLACLDGGDDGDRAVRYAVGEAQRRDTGVRLLHVPPEVATYAPMSPLYATPNLREIGARILKDAFDRCLEQAPDLYVEGALATGSRVASIVAESANAACVVVGTREWSTHGVFGRSTSAGVAARSGSPVIAVPPTWNASQRSGRVVVGLDAGAGPDVVLHEALDQARRRRAELTIVHAWAAPRPYEPYLDDWDAEAWQRQAEATLDELTAMRLREYPDVGTRRIVIRTAADDAISEAAQGSDLLVLGRHRSSIPLVHRLGSLAHHALHAGSCPLEIVPVAVH